MKAGGIVVFRADASLTLAMGHVMRCLALADALRRRGLTVMFVCREHEGHLCELIVEWGFRVSRLAPLGSADHAGVADVRDVRIGATWREDAEQTCDAVTSLGAKPDWLVVDHYALDYRWEAMLRTSVGRIMAIDDLADRRHDCDVILDQNYYENSESRYDGLSTQDCTRALGPSFALLRQEFYEARRALRQRDGSLKRVLVAFGGSDSTNETAKVLAALGGPAFREMQIDVVVGVLNRHKKDLLARNASGALVRVYEQPANIAELMATADLCVGAGGTMTWERCSVGLPTVVVTVADNQEETSRALHRAGVVLCLGRADDVCSAKIAAAVETLAGDSVALQRLSRNSLALMAPNGEGVTEMRILKTLVRSAS